MKIIDIQNQIIDEFETMDDWMERYEYMISLVEIPSYNG